MEKKYRMKFFAAFACLWAALLMASCSSGNDYVNTLPKDAAVVMSFDLESMARKSNLQGEAGKRALEKIKEALKDDLKGVVDKVMEDPGESGLELTDKVYVFVESGAVNVGLLAKVSSAGKLEKLLKALGESDGTLSLKKAGGCTYSMLGNGIVAYTDKAFLVLLDQGSGTDLIHTVQMMLRQKEAESFASTPDFKELEKTKGDILSYFSLSVLPSEYKMAMTMGMPSDINLSEVKMLASVSFEKGKMLFDIKNKTTNQAMLALQKKQQAAVKKLKGDFLNRFDRNVFLWTGCGLNGKAYFEALKENPAMKQLLDSSMIPVDFGSIIGAIDGDVTLAMPCGMPPVFIVWAEVNNDTFLRTFEDLKSVLAMTAGRMVLQNDGPKGYCFRSVDDSILGWNELYFGVKDDCFYLTNHRELIDKRPMGMTAAEAPWGKDVKGKMGFFGLNFDALGDKSQSMPGNWLQMLGTQPFDYLSGGGESTDECRIELVMKDKERNFLEQLVGLIP